MTLDLILIGLASMFSIGLRGFQHKNVQGNHYKLISVNSYFIVFHGIATQGLSVYWYAATGAAIGMTGSTWLHNKLVRKKQA